MSVAELYRIGDTIEIREQGGAGRMVSLHPSLQRTPTPEEGTDSEVRNNQTQMGLLCQERGCQSSQNMMSTPLTCMVANIKVMSKLRPGAAFLNTA